MTVGQVAAGGIAVGPRAAFAPTAAGLGSNPKKDSAFPAPAEADGKPFSFHFRSKSNGAAVDEGSPEQNSGRRGETFGASRGTARGAARGAVGDTPQRKQQPDVARSDVAQPDSDVAQPDNATALSATPLSATPPTSTALETARKIVRTLQTPSRAADEVTTSEAESHPAAETRSVAPRALFPNLEKPGDVSTVTASGKLESLSQAATPGAAIEQALAALRATNGGNIPRLVPAEHRAEHRAEQETGHTFSGHPVAKTRSAALQALIGNLGKRGEMSTTTAFAKLESLGQAATPGTPIEQAPAGLLASDADDIPHIEQGTRPAFSGRGADNPSSDLAVPSGSPHPAQGKERNPVENLRVTTEIEAADLVSARTPTAQRPDNPAPRSDLPLLPHRKVAPDDGESTRQYLDGDNQGENRVTAKAHAAVEQEIARGTRKPPRLDELPSGENLRNIDLTGSYRAIQPKGNESSVAAVPGPSNHSERLPEAAAELSNTTSAGPKSDPRLSHVEVPTGPQGNAAEKAAPLPLSAAHFSLRPAERRGDEGVSGGISSRRFSTGNPQEEAARLRPNVDLKAEDSARESQSNDAGSSRPPRNVRANAAESHLTENDPRAARVAPRSAETAPPRSVSLPTPEGTAGVATSSRIRPTAAASPPPGRPRRLTPSPRPHSTVRVRLHLPGTHEC